MSEQIVQCPGCGVKLKLKEDRVLPANAVCPKCNVLLFQKTKPASGPASTGTGRSAPAAAPARSAKPAARRPARDEFDEVDEVDEFEEVFEEESEDTRPRSRSRSRNRVRSSGGIPPWAIGAAIGVLAVSVVVGVILLLPRRGADVAQATPPATTPAVVSAPAGVATLPAGGNPNSPTPAPAPLAPGGVIPAGQLTGPASSSPPASLPAAIPAAPPIAGAGALAKYQPKTDSLHYYSFEVVSDFDQYLEKATGSCMLTAKKTVTPGFSVKREVREGSGTGFVVGSNGVIVTCAHVVDGTEKIDVVIGGQTYPATVLHSDSSLDLAVIKIEATGLPVLPLANSDQIQLGQPLRVIGFPLSDVLGTGVKITQGTVSGIVDRDGQRQIQTDATINPGNSGGPVFNTRGEVIGIASAKLAGSAISQVGFCVPSSTLSGMLQRQGIILAPAVAGQEMETPALVQKVSPAVAYIKVRMGEDNQSQVAFHYTATMDNRQEGKGGRFLMPRGFSLPAHESGDLSLTEFGNPVELSEGNYAPIIMSRLPLLPFVELSKSGQTDWTNQRDISIVREERSEGPTPRFRPRFGGFGGPLSGEPPKVVSVQKASERDQFHVTTNNAQQLVLSRTYELKTTDGSEPAIVLTGTGSWTFDRAEGMPTASDLKGTYKVTVSGVTVTIPFTVTITRWTQQQMDEVQQRVATMKAENDAKEERIKKGERPLGCDAKFVITAKSRGYKTVAMSPNGKTVAFTEDDKALFVYDLATGKEIDAKVGLDDLGDPNASTYSPDGKFLLVGGYKGIIRIWAVDDEGELDKVGDFVGHSSEIQSIEVSPDNKTAISSDNKNGVRVWKLDDQVESYSIPELKNETVEIGITSDGKSGLLVATDSEVSTFDLSNGKVTSRLPAFKSHFGKLAMISADGMMLFMPDAYKLTCFSLKGKKPPVVIDLGESLDALAYCPTTNEVFVGGDGKIHVCDWKKSTRTALLSTGADIEGDIKHVGVSPDGRFVVAIGGRSQQSVLIFDRQAPKGPAQAGESPDPKKPGAKKATDDVNPFQ